MSSIPTSPEVRQVRAAPVPAPPPPPAVQQHATSTPSFLHWRPTHFYQYGVHAYRVSVSLIARVWTPPRALDGVDSASFILFLSTGLVVMESYHAARYTLRQLRRFKTEAAFRHVSLLAGAPRRGAPPTSDDDHVAADGEAGGRAASRNALQEERDREGEGDDNAALTDDEGGDDVPPSWFCRALQRVRRILPRRAASASLTLSDESDQEGEGAAAVKTTRPLVHCERDISEHDLLSRDVSVPFEMSNMLPQRGESQMLYGAADGTAVAVGGIGHDDGVGGDEDEEDQTWEATPEMLMHYWKQLERTILNAPRHNARRFFRSFPEERPFAEPDLSQVNGWLDDVTKHLHRGTSTWSSWFSGRNSAGGGDAEAAAAALPAAAPARPHGWRQRLTFAVPQCSCFAYKVRPPPEDFNPCTEEEDSSSGSDNGVGGGDGAAAAAAAAESSHAPAERDTTVTTTTTPQAGGHVFRSHTPHWEGLMLIWCNVVEVSISSREIRALLLKASPPAFLSPAMARNDGPTDFDLASANLGILWYWSTLQRIFETLVVNEDVEKCEGDFEELQAYAMPLFFKCIARWPVSAEMHTALDVAAERNLGFICDVQAVWAILNAVRERLLSLRRRLYYRNTWSLVRYMYSSSKAKIMSAALITVMMTISSRVSSAGRVVRERIAGYIESGGAETGSGKGGVAMNFQVMVGLCAFELTRMAVQYVIANTTSEFIVLTASQRREVVKMQLYEALSHTQLTFYEQHTYEEVEEILYYVNDMEGIDVQLHQYLFNAIHIFIELKDALQPFTYRSMAVAAGVAMAPYMLRRIATLVERRYLLAQREGNLPSGAYAVEDEYHDDDDDANVLREGVMLRGDEIIAAIPQLRPYGADVRLVRWWNRHQQRRQHIKLSHHHSSGGAVAMLGGGEGPGSLTSSPLTACVPVSASRGSGSAVKSGKNGAAAAAAKTRQSWGEYLRELLGAWVTNEDVGLVRSAFVALVRLPHGKLLPGSGKALLDLSEWLLPMAASAYGIAWCGQPNLDPFQLLQGMQAIEAAVDNIGEARDTMEMVGYNAYKASMLERLLQPAQWEVVSREEEPYMANFIISANGVAQAIEERQTRMEQSRLLPMSVSAKPAAAAASPPLTVAPARAVGFYRRHVLRHIEVQNIRLRFVPADPAVLRRRRRQRWTASAGGPRRTTSALTHSTGPGVAAAGSIGTPTSATATPRSTSLQSSGGFEGGPLPRSDSLDRMTEDEDEEAAEEEEYMLDDRAPLFSADIILWSPPQQRGRFVCITAPNGGGKTALVNLLLALYVNVNGPLPSSAASSPHAGRLGPGAVTFCFASRTHNRRQRRGGLTGRLGNASAVNLARTGSSAHDAARPQGGLMRRATTSPGSPAAGDTGHSYRPDLSPTSHRPSMDRFAGMSDTSSRGEYRVDIRTIPADVLRRHIFSYVPELPTIFSGATVAQNISLAGYVSVATDVLMKRVTQCAELAQCDFVQRLPLGLLTRISDSTANSWNTAGQYSNGAGNTYVTRLSADQAKRLMLARAYFHGGEVLLMDEPTKEIEDVATAQKMCDGWRRLLERGYCSGVICVTMDPTLLNMADEVITLP